MDPVSAPPQIVALAEQRAEARAQRDWATADELKARIEAAGWRIVDSGTAFELAPARPADVEADGRTWYGAVESVPSHLDEPPTAAATVIVIATPGGDGPEGALRALAEHRSPGTQVVVVTPRELGDRGPADEVVGTATPFTAGDALQAALRRATGAIVVVLEAGRTPIGDVVAPLTEALSDPSVAIAGIDGLDSSDLHRYRPAPDGDVTTLRSGCYAFRRADVIARGPVDGRLHLRGSVAAWLGLLLRDEGPDTTPRRAVALGLPLETARGDTQTTADHARLARRDGYRIADRFRAHDWLGADEPPQGRLVGDGTQDDDDDEGADEQRDTAPA